MGAGPAFVAYHGARVASLGTSPIAIAVPSGGARSYSTWRQARSPTAQSCRPWRPARSCRPPRSDRAWRADDRSEQGRNPVAAWRSQGLGARLDVRDAGERARGGADPGARARSGEAPTLPQNSAILAVDVATFRPLADFAHDADSARGAAQGAAASEWRRGNTVARRARQPHRGRAAQIGHPDPGEAMGGACGDGESAGIKMRIAPAAAACRRRVRSTR